MKFEKWRKQKENVKNTIKTMPKKKRKTFTLTSDSSESEYETDNSPNKDYTDTSDGWSDESDIELSEDPQWDDFMAKLLSSHKTPRKTSTQI